MAPPYKAGTNLHGLITLDVKGKPKEELKGRLMASSVPRLAWKLVALRLPAVPAH